MSLPDDGERFTIFVWSTHIAPCFRDMIAELRGSHLAERARILAPRDTKRALEAMRGLPIDRIFVDHGAVDAQRALDYRKDSEALRNNRLS